MIGPGGHPVDPGSRSGDFGTHQVRFGSVVLYPSPHSLQSIPLLSILNSYNPDLGADTEFGPPGS